MTLVVAERRLFTAPDDLDRSPDVIGRQRKNDLYRHILAPTECPARVGVNDAHLVFRQVEAVRDLAPIVVRPLPRSLHDDIPIVVNPCEASVRLKVHVFLRAHLIRRVDDHVGCREPRLNIALCHAKSRHRVAALLRVQHRSIGGQSTINSIHNRQIVVHHADQFPGAGGNLLAFRDHERNALADVAHDLLTQHGLVVFADAVDVVRHIFRSQNRSHARECARSGGVDLYNAGVRTSGEQDLHVQHARYRQVTGEICCPTHFCSGIYPWEALPYVRISHGAPPQSLRSFAQRVRPPG